jgi:chemotaxis protein MotB
MARRKKLEDERDSLERWLVSYADFITLLFAFFVVMYAISSVNEGKYRILSESISTAFTESRSKSQAHRSIDPIQIGEIQRSTSSVQPFNEATHQPVIEEAERPIADLRKEHAQLQFIADRIRELFPSEIKNQFIKVNYHGLWLEVEMKSGLLFASGRAEIANEGLPMLTKLSEIFCQVSNAIHVEGYTDNVPINTREFPSNWELSSARAASVVHQFMRSGVDPARMAAIGYGEYHPIVDNGSEEGRYQNRRVVILLLSEIAARHKWMTDQRTKSFESPQTNPATQPPSKTTKHE